MFGEQNDRKMKACHNMVPYLFAVRMLVRRCKSIVELRQEVTLKNSQRLVEIAD
jgi:hypothetical protein